MVEIYKRANVKYTNFIPCGIFLNECGNYKRYALKNSSKTDFVTGQIRQFCLDVMSVLPGWWLEIYWNEEMSTDL